jgi:uncharacterized membrane protein
MMAAVQIFFIGLAIFVLGRVLAQFNNNHPANRLWIGAIVMIGMMVTFVGGILYIVTF